MNSPLKSSKPTNKEELQPDELKTEPMSEKDEVKEAERRIADKLKSKADNSNTKKK